MDRQHQAIQALFAAADSSGTVPPLPDDPLRPLQEEKDQLSRPALKRRRVGVSIACNECRRKKIRCDGQRPVCQHCTTRQTPCEYRDDIALTQESRKLLVEVVRGLNRLPASETFRFLEELRDADAYSIISSLRGRVEVSPGEIEELANAGTSSVSAAAAGGVAHPPALAVGGPGSEDATSDSAELALNNPVAYPFPSRSEPILLDSGSFRELTQSPLHRVQTPQRSDSAQRNTPGTQPTSGTASEATASDPCASNLLWSSDSSRSRPLDRQQQPTPAQQPPPKLCDARLGGLRIARWTDVQIDDNLAARCISLYLETDHPLLGHFDPDLFLDDLLSEGQGDRPFCSSLLVNSLLYWSCQMYSAIDPDADARAIECCTAAEKIWKEERRNGRDSILNMAACEFLSFGYLGQGRDHAVLKYMGEACEMGRRLELFGVSEGKYKPPVMAVEKASEDEMVLDDAARNARRANMYASWGVFNFATLMSLFYRQPGIAVPSSPPSLPIPEPSSTSTPYMGSTFPNLCRFWTIIHEVSVEYHGNGKEAWASNSTLFFAEFKFRELLAWSNTLPVRLSSNSRGERPHHVEIMHLWFHSAILDIFRPFTYDPKYRDSPLRTFASDNITPQLIYTNSADRLKRLILNYRLHHQSSAHTILWHTALLYAANAILESTEVEQKKWYPYMLLVLYGYVRLSGAWRMARAVSKGLLSMIMSRGDMSSDAARQILADMEEGQGIDELEAAGEADEAIRATFMLDLQKASTEPTSATVEKLAEDFEGNAMMMEYTNI